jgi:hypothetical protein
VGHLKGFITLGLALVLRQTASLTINYSYLQVWLMIMIAQEFSEESFVQPVLDVVLKNDRIILQFYSILQGRFCLQLLPGACTIKLFTAVIVAIS